MADSQIRPTRSDPDLLVGNEVVGGPAGDHEASPRFWTPLRIILVVGTLVYWVGLLRTYPCMSNGWLNPDRYEALCYSDIPVLYQLRGLADGLMPILEWPADGQPLEYPALTVVWVWLIAKGIGLFSTSPLIYYLATATLSYLLFVVALVATSLTVRRRTWDGLLLAASPAVLLASFINWDWLAVALTSLALLAWSRKRPGWAGFALGLAISAKFYPLLLLGPLFLLCLRDRKLAAFGQVLMSTAAAWLAVNVYFAVANPGGWSYFFTFSQERGPDFGSWWLMAEKWGWAIPADVVNLLGTTQLVIFCVGIAALIFFAPQKPRVAQVSFLVVAAFIVSNKVYSPQFVLWLLPLAILARPRWRDLIWWQLAQAVYFVAIWWYLVGLSDGERGLPDQWYAGAIAVHLVATIIFAVLVVRDILWPEYDPIRSDGDPSHADDPGGGALDHARKASGALPVAGAESTARAAG